MLTLGCTLNEVAYELSALTLLSVIYFIVGVSLFNRTRMQPD